MKNILFAIITTLCTFSLTLAQDSENILTGRQIIEKHLEAIGGRTKLSAIQDETMTLKNIPGDPQMSMTIIKKAPNKYYQFLNTEAFSQQVIFDGSKGKTVQFSRELFFDDAENARMSEQSNLHLLLNLDEFGYRVEKISDEILNGIDCYVLNIYFNNNVDWKVYIDKTTYYMIRQIIPIFNDRGRFTQVIDYFDYTNIDGYIYPGRISQLMDPQTVTLRVVSVKINTDVDDELFEMD